MRWAITIACAGCGRLAFEELAAAPADGPTDGANLRCTTLAFDVVPTELQKFGGGTAEIVAGQIRFSISGDAGSEVYLETTVARSFIGSSVALEVPSPSLTPSASTGFGWHEQTGDLIGVHLEMDGDNLKLNSFNPTLSQYDEYVSVPYDPVEFAWWQLREEGGVIVAEVSADGVTWNRFGSVGGLDLSNMKWDFGLGAYVGPIAPSESSIESAVDCTP